jgi:alkylhydroperoxidase family enzyme
MRSHAQAEQIAEIAASIAAFAFTNQPNRLP